MRLTEAEKAAMRQAMRNDPSVQRIAAIFKESPLTREDLSRMIAGLFLGLHAWDEAAARETAYRVLNVADAVQGGEKI